MKAILLGLLFCVSVSASVSAQAEDSILKNCHSGDERMDVFIEQTGADISMRLQDAPGRFTPPKGSSYDIMAQEAFSYVVKNKSLASFVNDKTVIAKMIESGLFSMKSWDGEYDMVQYYVSKYTAALKCN